MRTRPSRLQPYLYTVTVQIKYIQISGVRRTVHTGQVCFEVMRMKQKDFAAQAEQMDLAEVQQGRIAHLSGRQGLCMRAFVHGRALVLSILFCVEQ